MCRCSCSGLPSPDPTWIPSVEKKRLRFPPLVVVPPVMSPDVSSTEMFVLPLFWLPARVSRLHMR